MNPYPRSSPRLNLVAALITLTGLIVVGGVVTATFVPAIRQPDAISLIGTPEGSASTIGTVTVQQIVVNATSITDPVYLAQLATQDAASAGDAYQPEIDPNVITRVGLITLRNNASPFRIEPGLAPEWQQILAQSRTNRETLYGVLQFAASFDPEWALKVQDLTALGIRDLYYSRNSSTALAIIPSGRLDEIDDWIARGRLRFAGPLPVDSRIDADLWDRADDAPDDPLPVEVTLHELPDGEDTIIPFLLPGYRSGTTLYAYATGWVYPEDLRALAALPTVILVQPRQTEDCWSWGFENRVCFVETPPPASPKR